MRVPNLSIGTVATFERNSWRLRASATRTLPPSMGRNSSISVATPSLHLDLMGAAGVKLAVLQSQSRKSCRIVLGQNLRITMGETRRNALLQPDEIVLDNPFFSLLSRTSHNQPTPPVHPLLNRHRRQNSAGTVALSLLAKQVVNNITSGFDTLNPSQQKDDLGWIVGDGETPQKVREFDL